ncbi:MAG TPA: hypothetical protein VIU64_17785 [Polyangia bacterium]
MLLAVMGAGALGAWIFWAARGGIDLVEGRGRRAEGLRGGGSGDRSEHPASP